MHLDLRYIHSMAIAPWEVDPETLPALSSGSAACKPLSTALLPAQSDANQVANATWISREAQLRDFDKLSMEQQCMRKIFVREYLYDFKAYDAACRTGVADHVAAQWATKVLQEPWVKNHIKEVIEELDEKIIVSRNRVIMGLLKEAEREDASASHAARVGSWDKLASILGMKIEKTESNVNYRGGVMVVHASGTIDQWSAQAQGTQQQLKDDVRK